MKICTLEGTTTTTTTPYIFLVLFYLKFSNKLIDCLVISVTGGVAVIIGLYIVLWGKSKDNNSSTEEMIKKTLDPQICESCKIDLEEPLLPEKPSN